jgi:hypothetical protein
LDKSLNSAIKDVEEAIEMMPITDEDKVKICNKNITNILK